MVPKFKRTKEPVFDPSTKGHMREICMEASSSFGTDPQVPHFIRHSALPPDNHFLSDICASVGRLLYPFKFPYTQMGSASFDFTDKKKRLLHIVVLSTILGLLET